MYIRIYKTITHNIILPIKHSAILPTIKTSSPYK